MRHPSISIGPIGDGFPVGGARRVVRLIVSIVLATLPFFAGRAVCSAERLDKPNIVFLIADDLGYGELGCYGGREIATPHIDSLAREGVRCTSGYVTAPFCAASRAGLLTGRYQTRFGFEFNPVGAANLDPDIGLPPRERTLADVLRNAGYATSLVGKWHLGGTARFHPQRRGFDEFFGFLHEGHYYVPSPWREHVTWLRRKSLPNGGSGRWTSPDGRIVWTTHMGHFEPDYDADNPILRSSQPVAEPDNLTDAFTREAVDFIARHRAQPFFLCLAYNAVHSPMQGADRYLERYGHIKDIQRRVFAAMLAHLDDAVGTLLETLADCELSEQTLIVFLSDNGGATRELTSRNNPLRGEKGQLLEGGIRVPFLLRWPGVLPAGHVEERPVSSLDLFVTAAHSAGVTDVGRVDGTNLQQLITSPDDGKLRQLYWRMGQQAALRAGEWKIHRGRNPSDWQLFHLSKDVGEARDAAAEHPAKLAELVAAWEQLDSEMVTPLWGGDSLDRPATVRARP